MRLRNAQAFAESYRDQFAEACEDLAIVGSVRRKKGNVKDIELVLYPKFLQYSMMGEPDWSGGTQVDAVIQRLIKTGSIMLDPVVKRNGERYKRFQIITAIQQELALELFFTDADNFGNMVAIRTGDQDFSRRLVTVQSSDGYGLIPSGLRQRDGYLWDVLKKEKIPCRTEAAFFAALGIQSPPPPEVRNNTWRP